MFSLLGRRARSRFQRRSHLLPERDVANSSCFLLGLLDAQDGPQGRLSNSPNPPWVSAVFGHPLTHDNATGKAARFSPSCTCSTEILSPFTLKVHPSFPSGVTCPFWSPVRTRVMAFNELPRGGRKSASSFSCLFLRCSSGDSGRFGILSPRSGAQVPAPFL